MLLSACGGSAAAPSAPSSAAAKPASASAAAAPASSPAAATKPNASGLTKVRFRFPVATGAWVPFMVGKDANIYEKYGLDVDIQMLGGNLQVPSMLAGESDIAGTSAETVLSASAAGGQLTMFGAMIPYALGFLVATGDIKKVEDLKGGVVVVNGFGNVADFAMRRILAKYNLELNKDVSLRAVQQTEAEIAALKSGAAKAFMAYPPDDLRASQVDPAFHSIFDVRDLNVPYVQASLFTSKAYMTANRATVVKFMQATSEAVALEKKNPDAAIKSFQKYAKLDDPKIAARGESFYADVTPVVPAVNLEGLKNVLDVVTTSTPAAANLNINSVVDTSIADEVTKSGVAK
jgi:ABC-type nitrate/sulfonate/bicarbonate transport system substrate-binding protein